MTNRHPQELPLLSARDRDRARRVRGAARGLADEAGCEPAAVQIWSAWARLYGIGHWRDVTETILKSLAAPTNERTLAEVLAAMPDVGRDADFERPNDTEASP